MTIQIILLIAAIVVSWLAFTALLKVLKTTIATAITIAAIILILQILFGITYLDLWQQITSLPLTIWRTVTGSR
jgi:hypothetical protein